MTTHAPGPWTIGSGTEAGQILDADGERVCRVTHDLTATANAQVIATAPDLLNACKSMLHAFGNCGSPVQQQAADLAINAIRRAEYKP